MQAGEVFTITTYNLAPGTDTVLTLYGPDGSTELATSDDIAWPIDLSSRIVYTATTSGTYYAMVAPYPNTGGCSTSYDLSLVKRWRTYLPIIQDLSAASAYLHTNQHAYKSPVGYTDSHFHDRPVAHADEHTDGHPYVSLYSHPSFGPASSAPLLPRGGENGHGGQRSARGGLQQRLQSDLRG